MGQARKPVLVVVGQGSTVAPIGALFGRRGFMLVAADGLDALVDYLNQSTRHLDAAIIDFDLPDALAVAKLLGERAQRPVIVAIAPTGSSPSQSPLIDAAFIRPLDPARLFARVVILIGERKPKHEVAGRKRCITGVVAVVRGNALFHIVEQQLWTAVPPINAGAILERVLFQLDINPTTVTAADFAAALASGRLEQQLVRFGPPAAVAKALAGVSEALKNLPTRAA